MSLTDDNATATVDVAAETMTIDQTMDAAFDEIVARDDEDAAASETTEIQASDTDEESSEQDESESQDSTDQPEIEAVETDKADPPFNAPMSWSAEMKGKWAELSPELQKYVSDREKNVHDQFSRMGNELSALKPITEVFQAHQQTFARHGFEPTQAVQQLLRVQDDLDKDPVGTLQRIGQVYGIDISQLANGQASDQGQPDPQVQVLQRQVQTLQGQLAGFAQQNTVREERDQQAMVEQASKDLETSGVTNKPHFEELKADMADYLVSGKASSFAEAYDMAAWANPTVRETLMKAQRDAELEEQAKAAAKAKKSAKVNVGSKSKPVSQKPMTWEETLEATATAAFNS